MPIIIMPVSPVPVLAHLTATRTICGLGEETLSLTMDGPSSTIVFQFGELRCIQSHKGQADIIMIQTTCLCDRTSSTVTAKLRKKGILMTSPARTRLPQPLTQLRPVQAHPT
jgi:hypothetical protein